MKLTFAFASLAAFVSSALAALSINNPVAGTVWKYDGTPVTISWISSDNTVLTGTVTVQLMEGQDTNNLMPVLTIASNLAASLGKVTFTPPSNLPGSVYYAVRVTASVDGPHYSHQFQAGNPAITGPMSTSSTHRPTSSTITSAKTTKNEEDESSTRSSSSPSSSSSPKSSSTSKSSPESSSFESSESSEFSESSESSPSSSGAARPAVAAAGALGAAAAIAVALF
ncbi:hypothetical protein GGI20_004920 [Coemansia sp. BCRC 34301]|nr:hypothetical protein GGI20_004920 [Coemansia sp. BCRC 34301]